MNVSPPDGAGPQEQARLRDLLREAWQSMYEDAEREEAVAQSALPLARRCNDAAAEAVALFHWVFPVLRFGELDAALQRMEQTCTRWRELANPRGLMLMHDAQAVLLRRQAGEIDAALALLRTNDQAPAQQRPATDRMVTLLQLSAACDQRGLRDEALRHVYRALALSRECGIDSLRAVALNNLANLHDGLGNVEDAALLHEQSHAIWLQLSCERPLAFSTFNLMHCWCLLGRHAEAWALFEQWRVRPASAQHMHAADSTMAHAEACIGIGRLDEAERLLGAEPLELPLQPELAFQRADVRVALLLAQQRAGEAVALSEQAMAHFPV